MTANERIARWRYSKPADEPCILVPRFDTDITLWHGEDGLLAMIEEKGLQMPFLRALRTEVRPDGCNFTPLGGRETWQVCRATPAQLAAALCEVIPDG